MLALGVILVTVNNGGSSAKSAAAAAVSSSSHGLDYVAGMVACSISGLSSAYAGERAGRVRRAVVVCCLTGLTCWPDEATLQHLSLLPHCSARLAGVYFEKYVKGKHAASLWVRNIQLGIYGVPLRCEVLWAAGPQCSG